MATATLTSKGQTTIPKAVRQHLGLKPGDRMRFLIGDDGRVVVIAAKKRVRELRGSLPAPQRPVPLEEMEEAIGERAAEEWQPDSPA
jgi:antitoxin PrlF